MLRLSNGIDMPAVGFGTYQMTPDDCYRSVLAALETGYRLIDTATVYRNEESVGKALKDSGILRSDVFVTTKIAPADHGDPRAYDAGLECMSRLGLEYIDLLLLHWPGTRGLDVKDERNRTNRLGSWIALQRLYEEGKVKSIGVSNYTIRHLKELIESPECRVVPHVNQVECHPFFPQDDLLAYCKEVGITVTAYSSLGEGRPELLEHPAVTTIASQRFHGDATPVTPAQVLLKWALQHGLAVIPKSITPSRIRSNFCLLDFALMEEDMARLDGLDSRTKYCWNPEPVV